MLHDSISSWVAAVKYKKFQRKLKLFMSCKYGCILHEALCFIEALPEHCLPVTATPCLTLTK